MVRAGRRVGCVNGSVWAVSVCALSPVRRCRSDCVSADRSPTGRTRGFEAAGAWRWRAPLTRIGRVTGLAMRVAGCGDRCRRATSRDARTARAAAGGRFMRAVWATQTRVSPPAGLEESLLGCRRWRRATWARLGGGGSAGSGCAVRPACTRVGAVRDVNRKFDLILIKILNDLLRKSKSATGHAVGPVISTGTLRLTITTHPRRPSRGGARASGAGQGSRTGITCRGPGGGRSTFHVRPHGEGTA
jgi:hypothetical protein